VPSILNSVKTGFVLVTKSLVMLEGSLDYDYVIL